LLDCLNIRKLSQSKPQLSLHNHVRGNLTNQQNLKTEIKIILPKDASNKAKGNCFEDLTRNLLSVHQYKISQNINFSGMEIDLIAEHKHKQETLYVECKAKEKVSSDELTKFCFNVSHKKADSGYFFRTNELEYQAGALLKELRADERYRNLTFFEPSDIIQMLSDGGFIFEPEQLLSKYKISKKLLAVTYFGDFLIYLINSSSLLPTDYLIFNANDNSKSIEKSTIEKIELRIEELASLNYINETIENKDISKKTTSVEFETISEVQESENWYDYLPASEKDFVGRANIRSSILDYFISIQDKTTQKRIFYLNGKSGWGKSSLVSEIRGRCRNKYYKNRFYTVAIDTRSASSNNFVALALEKIINKAITDKFIESNLFDKPLNFTSNTDLLSSESIKSILKELELKNRFLILIFDQFEDVFRKKDLFKSFYKFLSDVTDSKPNIIIGFSWKTEIVIPIEHEAYSYWQQAKEQAREFTISEFGEKEINGIIKQLENSIGKLSKEIKNRIKESSQGLPWLTKKLCIHIYQQIESGVKKDNLIESNLNIQDLFENDKERIDGNELKALKLIAKKAYDGNFFDISDIGESIQSTTIESLLNKRLIIRSGANYNIYWDIFRDYLVTDKIPTIGESYLLRQGVNLCSEAFLLFEKDKKETLDSLLIKYSKSIGKTSLDNILIELRNIGLVRKVDDNFTLTKDTKANISYFKKFITDKFKNYTPYLELKKLKLKEIKKSDVTKILKRVFKNEFKDATWDTYSKTLIGWFLFADLDISDKIVAPKRGRGIKGLKLSINSNNYLPRNSKKEIFTFLDNFSSSDNIPSKYRSDLFALEIIDENRQITDFGENVLNFTEAERKETLKTKLLNFSKMNKINAIVKSNPKIKAKELIDEMNATFFTGSKLSSKIIYASKILTWLK
jgi:hypothetical protein